MALDELQNGMATGANTGAATPPTNTVAGSDTSGGDENPFAEIEDELRTRYELLPEDIKKALMDTGYQQKLFDIAKAQKLTYEELGVLERETTMVLLGMTKPSEYKDEIQVSLKKNDPEAEALFKAIDEQIFMPVRTSLEKVYSGQVEETPAEKPAADIKIPTFAASAPAPAPSTDISSAERSVLEKTGITLADTPAEKGPTVASPLPSRTDILSAIENPPKTAPRPTPNIVANKLSDSGQTMPPKTTDYSVQKPTQAPPATGQSQPPRSADPYREPIE